MNMKRKLLCVTVLTMLLLAVTAGTAFADGEQAQIGETKYATLDAAISAAKAGDTIQLKQNDTLLKVNICKKITIDTNECTLLVPSGSDVVLENVKIQGNTPNKTLISVFGKLTLGNGTTVEKTVADDSGEGTNVIYMGNGGQLTVDDGAIIESKNSSCIAAGLSSTARTYIYGGSMNNSVVGGGGSGAELIVKGGTIQKIDGYSDYPGKILISGGNIASVWSPNDSTARISGGSITEDPKGSLIFSCCQRDATTGVVSHTSSLTADANGIYHCNICGGDYTNPQGLQAVLPQVVSAHNTTFHGAVAPTCTEAGNVAYYSCSNCGLNFEDAACSIVRTDITINALGHTSVTDSAVPATCTATGLTEGSHCGVCGEILTAQTETEALGHTSVNDEAVVATCTATGLTGGSHCSVCGEILAAQTTVNALGHDWGSWTKVDSTTHKRICKREGCAAEETAAHTFQNRTCTGCGYTKPSDHDYSGSSSGGSTVVKPAPSVPQAPAQTGYIQLTVDSLQASVFGTPVMLDCKPFIQSDRTMVPVRFVAEHMGCMVDWNADLQQVSITRPGSGVITLTIGQIPAGFDAAPVIQADRTMVPIRYISELLGYHVGWDGMTGTVTISR